MTEKQWQDLREWLSRVFDTETAAELFAEHVQEAREAGLPLPLETIA